MRHSLTTFVLALVVTASPAVAAAQWPCDGNGPPPCSSTGGMTFRPGIQMVTVSWLRMSPDTSLRYHVLRAADSVSLGADISGPLTALAFVDKVIPPGTTYFYSVRADYIIPAGTKDPRTGQLIPYGPKQRTTVALKYVAAKPTAVELPKKKP